MENKTMKNKNFFTLALVALFLMPLFLAGCTTPPNANLVTKDISKFKNFSELIAAFKDAQQNQGNYGLVKMGIPVAPMMESANSGPADSARGSTDYSTTNVQVQGVDEADIIKTDGRYVYNFSKNRIVITDAFPLDDSQIVSTTELKDIYPVEMFVSENRLLLFGNRQGYYGDVIPMPAVRESKIAPDIIGMPYFYGGAIVQLYDITDKANPVLEKEFEYQGNYLTSRLIGKDAFFVINSHPGFYPLAQATEENFIPSMREDGVERKIAKASEIGFLPPMPPSSFVTIVSLNLVSEELNEETIVGSAESVFASQDNLYIAGTAWLAPDTPVIKDAQRIIWGNEEKTIVNKFALQNGTIGFVGQGSVPGHVLNQFSMDEFEGKFRVATTLGEVFRMNTENPSKNNLYVLDEEMKIIGKLEDIAPGERIYSARFMGNRAYMVTFKKVDPLFVIDVSDPTNPKVLGKLKIPGYSDYLHPIDETHLIGVGKDTIESSYGDFAWYQGMKLAIFDVSDVENPAEMHKLVIGDRGTDSYALHDHKAFLYDKEKELLVLPIMLSEISASQKQAPIEVEGFFPAYGEPVFQGAFVYRVTLENGFEEKGRITHISAQEELQRGYYYGDEYSVKRALFIENVLYTLSDKMLKANSLQTLEELKEFVFP